MQILVFLVEMLVVAGALAVAISSVRQNGARIVEALAGIPAPDVAAPLPRRITRARQPVHFAPAPLRAAA